MCQHCGKVIGTVKKSNGEPWIGALVFLEGMQFVNAKTDGSFAFDNVPPGVHNIVVYRPGQSDVYTFLPVEVKAGITSNIGNLNPDNSGKLSFTQPQSYGNFLYFQQSPSATIKKMNLTTGAMIDFYTQTRNGCDFYNQLNFDIARHSGKIAIVDYASGCPGHQGVYVMDQNGQNFNMLLNFKSDAWCGAGDVAWSPDETKIAVTACYNYNYAILVFDVNTKQIIGQAWASPQMSPTFYNFKLHGWDPNGNYLLYSAWKDSPNLTFLYKISVQSMGTNQPLSTLLFQGALESATWSILNTPDTKPAPTFTVSVTNGNRVNIGWSKVPNVKGYYVYYAPYPDAKQIGKIDVKKQSQFSFSVPYGSAYYLAALPYDEQNDTKKFGLSNIVQFIVK
jgi:hypothetical protein